LFFFQPKKNIFYGEQLEIQYLTMCEEDIDEDLDEINLQANHESKVTVEIKNFKRKNTSIKVSKMPSQQGDLYEANFCMEFYAENAIIDPLDKFLKLNEISQPPFAVFLKQPPICFRRHQAILKKENFLFTTYKRTSKRFWIQLRRRIKE
jgi:para-aminobenzoate synthetase component 1